MSANALAVAVAAVDHVTDSSLIPLGAVDLIDIKWITPYQPGLFLTIRPSTLLGTFYVPHPEPATAGKDT